MKFGCTIAICTYNGSEKITKAINSIAHQKNIEPSNVELIVVDNASTDNTLNLCKLYIQEINFPYQVSFISEPKSGAIYARLKALHFAKYQWLLICDDDNELDPQYISLGLDILNKNKNIGALGGYGIEVLYTSKPKWFDKYSKSYAVQKQNFEDGKINKLDASIYGAGTFFNVQVLKENYNKGFINVMIGPNKNELSRGEDTEWCYLLLLNKKEIWYNHQLKFKHHLNNERISWSYYVQLKKGIASGSALLFSYHHLLKSKNKSSILFIYKYLNQILYLSILFLKCLIKRLYIKNNDFNLGYIIIRAKMISFFVYPTKAYKNFEKLKKSII